MSAVAGMQPALVHRVKLIVVAALLAFSLVAGFAGTTTQVDAKQRQQKVTCDWYNQQAAYSFFDERVGPEGYWDCYFDER